MNLTKLIILYEAKVQNFDNNLNSEPVAEQEHDTQNTTELNQYKSLWKAVITQALMDASSNSTNKKYRVHKIRALKWLQADNYDFQTICSLAELDPVYVKHKINIALKNGCKWRNDHKSGKTIKL